MPVPLKTLQKEVEQLAGEELNKFSIWFNRYLTRYENERQKDDATGVSYKQVQLVH